MVCFFEWWSWMKSLWFNYMTTMSHRLTLLQSKIKIYKIFRKIFKHLFICTIWKKSLILSFLFIHLSRRDGDSSLQEVLGRVDQLKQAAGSLQEVTNSINQLSQLAKSQKEEIMANVGLQPLKEAFACLVCKGTCKICNSRSFFSTKHSRLPPSSTALTSCHGCSSPSSTFTRR